jgi:hypothetical protein
MVVSTDHHVVWLDVSMVKIMGLQVHNPWKHLHKEVSRKVFIHRSWVEEGEVYKSKTPLKNDAVNYIFL